MYLFVLKQEKNIASRCSAPTKKTRVLCAQGAYEKFFRQDCMDWRAESMTIPKYLDSNERKTIIRNQRRPDGNERNHYPFEGSFT